MVEIKYKPHHSGNTPEQRIESGQLEPIPISFTADTKSNPARCQIRMQADDRRQER
jgi:hypothetical protein